MLYVSTAGDFSSHIINGQSVSANYYAVTGLSPNTTYYYRVKAQNSSGQSGISGSAQVTTGPPIPGVQAASGIQTDRFTANWQSSTGATGYYLDVATNSSFSTMVSGYATKDVGNVTSYQVNTGLNPGTTYYLRVRAYNGTGTSTNSETVSVTTLPALASVATDSVSGIGFDSALVQGNITYLGAPNPTQHGVVWSTSENPTVADNKTKKGAATGTGTFTSEVTGLNPNTTYYVRAYATNSAGTAYGDQVEFKTEKKALTITAHDKSKTYGEVVPAFTVGYSGFITGDNESVLTGTLNLTRVAGENFGTYTITPSGLTSEKYDITFVDGTLTINKKALTITADDKSKVYGAGDPSLTYRITAGGLVGSDTVSGALSRAAGENVGSYGIEQGTLECRRQL